MREDETLAALRKRIELFHSATTPVLDYYREKGILHEVDGEASVEEVFAQIISFLE